MTPEALTVAREVLAPDERVWLVGGAVRDRLLGRATDDVDLVVDGDVRDAAKRLARAVGGPAFALSDAWGAWRVIGPARAWQADFTPLRGGSLDADLALRDFTINAIAEPLHGGELVDPFGGAADLERAILRAVGPQSFSDDPLRVLRLSRLACELGLTPEPATRSDAHAHAAGLAEVAQERVFAELKRVVSADAALDGLALMEQTGALRAVLPELDALRGVEQTVYHHRDAYGHTLEVLHHAIELERDPQALLGDDHGAHVAEFLMRPLADELTRAQALRFAALLHDAAKPLTQVPNPKGGFGFPGHDRVGATLVDEILGRLRTSVDLRRHVAAITRHHLRPGFLVHERPLPRRAIHAYLVATEPVEVDTALLSVADRLATRGRKADEAIARHLDLVRELLGPALEWHEHGPPPPLLRGDELARETGIAPGPELGRVLGELAAAQYAGEVATREDAIRFAASSRPPV